MNLLTGFFKSKKFVVMLFALLLVILFGLIPSLQNTVSLHDLLTPLIAYIVGQGLADVGKNITLGENK